MTPAKVRAQEDTRRATEARGVLTPVEAHRDKIHKRMDIEVVFIRSIIEYRIYGKRVSVIEQLVCLEIEIKV